MLNWRDPKNPLSGGAERVSAAYLAALVDRGHEVYWFSYDFKRARSEEKIGGITFLRGGGKGTSIWKAIRWYRQQKSFDLVIDQHHGIPWFAPWWCRTNCVAYIHEVLGPIWDSFYSWPLSTIGRWLEKWTIKLYYNVPFWTPSESTRKLLHANHVPDVTVFPNGCDTIPLAELPPKSLRSPLRLISVSRLAPNKRVDHAIRATKLLNERGIETSLVIVGTGEVEATLRELAAGLNLRERVNFTGQLSEKDKNEQLQNAHLLVHCSVREGWGLNVIEANAMGTPAVVYPVGGLVDSTIHQQTGIITAAETPESLADAIGSIQPEPQKYAAYRAKAWERAKTFQWNQVLPKVCDWLESQARARRKC